MTEAKPEATLGMMLAFREWESYTCIKFQRRKLEKYYIEFFMNCSGYVLSLFIFPRERIYLIQTLLFFSEQSPYLCYL